MVRESLNDMFLDVWGDQADFNLLFRTPPETFEERSQFTKDMTLAMTAEVIELLNTIQWKSHRKVATLENRAHTVTELVDIFKYWLTLVQSWGVTPQEFFETYWAKSAVCRQRYTEEWMEEGERNRPIAVVDLDNTICDYISGLCAWIAVHYPAFAERARVLARERQWINAASVGVTEPTWQMMKHQFRVSGAKRHLPAMPGAEVFMQRLQRLGYSVVILTSRPIDKYPNIYTDTLGWLKDRGFPFTHLWWAHDKGERLAVSDGVLRRVHLFVDDELRYVTQVAQHGIRCVWLTTSTETPIGPYRMVSRYANLEDLVKDLGVSDVVL